MPYASNPCTVAIDTFIVKLWMIRALHYLGKSALLTRDFLGVVCAGTATYQLNPVCPPVWGMNNEIGKAELQLLPLMYA